MNVPPRANLTVWQNLFVCSCFFGRNTANRVTVLPCRKIRQVNRQAILLSGFLHIGVVDQLPLALAAADEPTLEAKVGGSVRDVLHH